MMKKWKNTNDNEETDNVDNSEDAKSTINNDYIKETNQGEEANPAEEVPKENNEENDLKEA